MNIIKTLRRYRLFAVHIGAFTFSPGVISTVVTIALLYLMISLGFWQLDRAAYKESLQDSIAQRKALAPVGLDELPATVDERRYKPVEISGSYDVEHSFLLDNRTLAGKVGYHVFTPLLLPGRHAVLVARGFISMGRLREELPVFETPSDAIMLRGILDLPPPRALLLMDDVQQTGKWPVVLQYIDVEEIGKMLGYPLYDMVLWTDESKDADDATTLVYDMPVLNLNSAKNNGYAFQWFAMSTALLIIYLLVNTKRHNTQGDSD